MYRTILAVVVAGGALALGACASQPKDAANQETAQQGTHMKCFSFTPVGTHIPKTQCMTEANYVSYKKAQEKQSEKDRAKLRQMQQQGQAKGCTTNC